MANITRFTNGRIFRSSSAPPPTELWVDSTSGLFLSPQAGFYDHHLLPTRTIDLRGRILCPGFIDAQLNGAYGFDLSAVPEDGDMRLFEAGMREMERRLAETGVTAYLATMTSQKGEVYRRILPYLAPPSTTTSPPRKPGAESLGAHCEGPFMSRHRRGCHSPAVVDSIPDCHLLTLEDYYGSANLQSGGSVKMVTLAPELTGAFDTIRALSQNGVLVSIGHTEADYETAVQAVRCGATMVTHLFNAMNSLHHRDPGPFGVITNPGPGDAILAAGGRPYFGLIADGIHLHPASVRLAHAAHPDGLILVTDAVMFMGHEDGLYDWLNGQRVRKEGLKITLQGTDTIAGSAVSLIECVNNFLAWTDASITTALAAVTSTPAAMLGLSDRKGTLTPGCDADFVILTEWTNEKGRVQLVVDEVWKFGVKVFSRQIGEQGEPPRNVMERQGAKL